MASATLRRGDANGHSARNGTTTPEIEQESKQVASHQMRHMPPITTINTGDNGGPRRCKRSKRSRNIYAHGERNQRQPPCSYLTHIISLLKMMIMLRWISIRSLFDDRAALYHQLMEDVTFRSKLPRARTTICTIVSWTWAAIQVIRQIRASVELLWHLIDAAVEKVINRMEHAYSKEEEDILMTVDTQDGAKREREETSAAADMAITGYEPPKKNTATIPPEDENDNMPSIIETPTSVSTESYWGDAASEDDKHDANENDTAPESRERPQKPPMLTPIQENTISINDGDISGSRRCKRSKRSRDIYAHGERNQRQPPHYVHASILKILTLPWITIQLLLEDRAALYHQMMDDVPYKILKRQTTLFEQFPNSVVKPTEDITTPMEDTVETANSLASPQEQVGRKYMSLLAGYEGPRPTLSPLNAEYMLQYVKSEYHCRQKYLMRMNVLVDSTLGYFYVLGKGPIDTFFLGFFLPDVIKWMRGQFATYIPVVYYHWWYYAM